MKENYLSVHGSRTLTDERVKILILEAIDKYKTTAIVTHGEPEGVCEVARKLCKDMAMPLKLHYLDFSKCRGAFENRSKKVFKDAEIAIIIHDGISKGTSNELQMCIKYKIKHEYHKLQPSEHKVSVGFAEDWDLGLKDML